MSENAYPWDVPLGEAIDPQQQQQQQQGLNSLPLQFDALFAMDGGVLQPVPLNANANLMPAAAALPPMQQLDLACAPLQLGALTASGTAAAPLAGSSYGWGGDAALAGAPLSASRSRSLDKMPELWAYLKGCDDSSKKTSVIKVGPPPPPLT